VFCQDAANDVLVNLDTEGMRDLLSDAHATEFRVAHPHLDDCGNEFEGWPLRSRFTSMSGGRKEQTVLAIDQRPVKLEQRRGLEDC
jgi:hypothetical protein